MMDGWSDRPYETILSDLNVNLKKVVYFERSGTNKQQFLSTQLQIANAKRVVSFEQITCAVGN